MHSDGRQDGERGAEVPFAVEPEPPRPAPDAPPPRPDEIPSPEIAPEEAPPPPGAPMPAPAPEEVPAPRPDEAPPAPLPREGPGAAALGPGIASGGAGHAPSPPADAAPPRASVLEVRGLSKRYGAVHALAGLDLTVHAGEVYGFLGRNGAGKSTTIRILMGITERTAGTVSLFGEPAQRRDVVRTRQRIGYVAQEQTFYGWMTPLRLASFVGSFYPSWDQSELLRLARRLDVPLDRAIGTFSGGMRVKVALAIALAHRPPLLLLDEPTAGLDPVARREFLEIVRDEGRRSGRTTFFSSHLVDEVELVAHRVGIVEGGRMRYEGSVRALRERVRLVTRPAPLGEGEGGRPAALDAPPPHRLGVPGAAGDPLLVALEALGFRLLYDEVLEGQERLFVEAPGADDDARWDALAGRAIPGVAIAPLPLEEIFVAMVRRRPTP